MSLNISESPYKGSGALTRAQFLFYEMRTTATHDVPDSKDEESGSRVDISFDEEFDELKLSVRAYNRLIRTGAMTFEDLSNLTDDDV